MGYTIGVDIGTSGTKSLLIDSDGNILAESSATYDVLTPKPRWTEQDPEDWWNATVKTIRAVVKKSKVKAGDVKAIGLSGQMHGSVFLDKRGKVLRPALLWNDQRTVAECEEITELAGGRDELIRMVANPAMTGFTAPKILWLRNKEPKKFDRLAHVLLPKDEIRRRLTGELATEVSDASGMLLLDVRNRKWSSELLGKLQIDPELLATVYESEDVTGNLRPEIAEKLGLTTDCVVVGGAGDCAAGAVGNGIVRSGILTASLGTSGVMFIHSDEPQYDKMGRLHTFCHAVRGKWHMMGVTLSAAGSMQWFVDNVCPELAKRRGADPLLTLNAEALEVAAGAGGLLFTPYLSGERSPHVDPNARASFVGLTANHGRGHMARAVMEGVAMSLRESLEIFKSLDVPVREMRVSGGGAKSPLWRQIFADVMNQAACTINAEQGAAYGVALLAAVGAGQFKDIEEACKATIEVVQKTAPKKPHVRTYDKLFPIYQSLYGSLKNSMDALGEI
ncbi:xylulokinase [Aureliella helgolandensis]|uniref:Xylulose kinase n=1 Tax=Aureliella helgolandensis TaxID=2527968 RepID=A0A518G680_9BACT|nr:xylulokinase [Aureliella helgolandensis]QDV24093.1 Xylulose kinase [Aureliella helgolandensis]